MLLSAEAYALGQSWAPRYEEPGVDGGHSCSIHSHDVGPEAYPIMIEWLYMPRPWQIAAWGHVLDHNGTWLCPNAWHTASIDAERLRSDISSGAVAGLGNWYPEIDGDEDHPTLAGLIWTAVDHWQMAIERRDQRQGSSPHACTPYEWRCSLCNGSMEYQLRQFVHVCPPLAAQKGDGSSHMTVEGTPTLWRDDADVLYGSPVPAPETGSRRGVPTDAEWRSGWGARPAGGSSRKEF
jgi:hypothetical protein